MDEKRRYQLWAESVREIGILLLVFGPLETLLRAPMNVTEVLIAFALAVSGFILIFAGVKMGADI